MDGDEWSPTRPSCFNPEESACGTQWISGWVGPTVGDNTTETRKISSPAGNRTTNPRLSTIPITGSQNIWIRARNDVTDFARRTTTPTAKPRWTITLRLDNISAGREAGDILTSTQGGGKRSETSVSASATVVFSLWSRVKFRVLVQQYLVYKQEQ